MPASGLQLGLAGGADILGAVPIAGRVVLQDDAFARDGEAALTSVVLGLAIAAQQAVFFDLPGKLNPQGELARRELFEVVSGLIGQGGLKFAHFLVCLGKLCDQVRLGSLSVDDGLLRLDDLIVELGADLAQFRPVPRINGAFGELHDRDDCGHGAMEFTAHG